MKYLARIDDITYEIEIMPDGVITVDGEPVEADLLQVDPLGLHSLLINHQSYEIVVEEQQRGYRVTIGSATFTVDVADERQLRMESSRADVSAGDGALPITAPIPGLVVKILVEEGQTVALNDPLIILEAMKMENEIRAPREGVVKNITVEVGQSVEGNVQMMVLGPVAVDEA
jgi:biotin carboxyl carrier protein